MRTLFQAAFVPLLLLCVHVKAQLPQSVPDAPQPAEHHAPSAPPGSSLFAGNECASYRAQSSQALAKRDYAAATNLLQQAASDCPNRDEILETLARAEMLAKRFDDSEHTLDGLLSKNPDNVQALTTQGELFYLVGKSSDAVVSLQKASAAAPASVEPHYLLGRIYYQQSSLALAEEQFKIALRLDADAYKAYDGLALCYESLGSTGLAAQTYMKGIAAVYKAHPEYDVIYADFAEFMLRFKENDKALQLAGEAVQRNPETPRNYLLAGKALQQKGEYQASLRWFLRAAQMDPAYPDPHLELARIYRKLGNDDKARTESALFAKLSEQAPPVRR